MGGIPALEEQKQGFVCLRLHAGVVFVACSARQLPAVTPAIIELDSAVAVFLGKADEGVTDRDGCERGRKGIRVLALTSPAKI